MHAHAMHVLPSTRSGRCSLVLALGFVLFNLLWSVLPGGASLAFACGIAAGVLALVAVLRRGERGVLVFAALTPFVAVVGFVLAELLLGHD